MPDGRHDEHRMMAPMREPPGDAAEVGLAWIRPASADDDDHDSAIRSAISIRPSAASALRATSHWAGTPALASRPAQRWTSVRWASSRSASAPVTSTSQGSGPPKVRIQVATAGSAASVAGLPSTPTRSPGRSTGLELDVRTDEEHRLRQPAEETLRDAAQQPLPERPGRGWP